MRQLSSVISATIRERRIGRPVSLRLHTFLSADHGRLLPDTASSLGVAEEWFSKRAVRLDARGSVAEGCLTVMAEFAAGETALICGHALADSTPRVDLYLFGSQGVLHHDGFANAEAHSFDETPEAPQRLLSAIQKSLESNTIVDL